MVKLDIHTHTTASTCSIFTPAQLAKAAVFHRLPAVIVTNHFDNTGDTAELKELLSPHGILLFAGMEITNSWGDFLLFGEDLQEFQYLRGDFPIDLLPRNNIAVIWAHPYRFYSYREVEKIKDLVSPYIDAIEVINGNCMRSFPEANNMAFKLARRFKKPATAGSDAHSLKHYLKAYTIFQSAINSYKDMINAIKEGKVEPAIGH